MTKDYYGTKRVTAWPETRDGVAGYAVKYADGYVSWSPPTAFEAAYKPVDAMGFEGALAAMKDGHRVKRPTWEQTVAPKFIDVSSLERWVLDKPDLLAEDWMIVE